MAESSTRVGLTDQHRQQLAAIHRPRRPLQLLAYVLVGCLQIPHSLQQEARGSPKTRAEQIMLFLVRLRLERVCTLTVYWEGV